MDQPSEKPRKAVRKVTYHHWVLFPFVLIMRMWMGTLRVKADPETRLRLRGPGVYVFWHNRLFIIPEVRRRFIRKERIWGLISASRDGAWTEALLRLFGIGAVRGSSNYRGAQAVKELIRVVRGGGSIGVAPDGSTGPRYVVKPGAAFVAKSCRMPVILVNADFERAWRLNSWDRFFVPKPFSRVHVRCARFEDWDALGTQDVDSAARMIQERMLAIQEEDPLHSGDEPDGA